MKKKILSIMLSMVFAVSLAATSVFNTKVAKADDGYTYEYNDVLVGTKNLNNTTENSAKLGDVLIEPEKGWKRLDNTNRNLERYDDDGFLLYSMNQSTAGTGKGFHDTAECIANKTILRFKFKGTKFRIINYTSRSYAGTKMKVTIDGKDESLNQYVSSINDFSKGIYLGHVLSYEKTGMEYGEHIVEIGVDSNSIVPKDSFPLLKLDAIDIDENGELSIPMKLNKSSLNLSIGDTDQLLASLLPDGVGGNKKECAIRWRSNNQDVVKVDQTGKITALKEGKATITATISTYLHYTHIYDQCEVNVTNGQVATSIVLDKKSLTLGNETSSKLKATVLPDNAANKKVIWTSSDESIVKVDQQGNVTALKEGHAVVTAKVENTDIKDTCDVKVQNITISFKEPVETEVGVWQKDGIKWVFEGGLEPIVSPENAINKELVWTSSDESLVKVLNNGFLIPNGNGKEGVATITVRIKDTDIKATCNVQMRYWKDNEMVTLNKETLNLNVGSSEKLIPQIKYFIHKDMTLISSDDSVAKIDKDGNVTGVKEGTAKISVIVHGEFGEKRIVKDICEVNVTNGQVSVANSISLDQNNACIGNNSSLNLKATVSPSNAINKKVVWTSSNENIATVDQEGNVKSVGYGQVVITAKIENTDIKATCDVEVSEI